MNIFELNCESIKLVAKLMSTIKPEFWDYDGAVSQLSQGVGWFCKEEVSVPTGWLLCKEYKKYKVLEIECMGFNMDGEFTVDSNLTPLLLKAEEWAKDNGFSMLRFVIGTRGLSCHSRELGVIWKELRDLHSVDRSEYDWYLSLGYEPSGILPNTYGDKYHGVVLIKQL